MFPSDLNMQYANDRYKAELTSARIRRLIRAAQATKQPTEQPARADALIARILDALRPRRPARA
jgi:hypothetical protein